MDASLQLPAIAGIAGLVALVLVLFLSKGGSKKLKKMLKRRKTVKGGTTYIQEEGQSVRRSTRCGGGRGSSGVAMARARTTSTSR